MKTVFLLQHSYNEDECEETKIIGIYSTRERADGAVEEYRLISGFSDHQNSFYIDEYEIDQNNWEEGFERTNSTDP